MTSYLFYTKKALALWLSWFWIFFYFTT